MTYQEESIINKHLRNMKVDGKNKEKENRIRNIEIGNWFYFKKKKKKTLNLSKNIQNFNIPTQKYLTFVYFFVFLRQLFDFVFK